MGPTGRSGAGGRTNGRAVVGAVLAVAMLALAAPGLGWVAAPDPLWLPGVYDGGDPDELVLTLGRTDGVEPSPVLAPVPVATPVVALDPRPLMPVLTPAVGPPRPRAPPGV
jgi:hypothetical protein